MLEEQKVTIISDDIETTGKITLKNNIIYLNLGITKQVIDFNDIKVIEKNDDHSISFVLSDNSLIKLKLKDYLILYKIVFEYIDSKKSTSHDGIKCKECGEYNNKSNKECFNCGYPLKVKVDKKIKKKIIVPFCILLFLFLSLLTVNIVYNKIYTPQSCFVIDVDGIITDYDSSCTKNIKIPKYINFKKVKEIGENAFSDMNIKSVSFPDSLKKINIRAFENNKITKLIIPDSVTTIRGYAFSDNNISSLHIGNKVSFIGSHAFENNKLNSLTLPDSVTYIKDSAFANCYLDTINLSSNLKEIGASAFYDNNLSLLVIPDSVETIQDWAFAYNKLEKVIIGKNVKNIGDNAFDKHPTGVSYQPNNSRIGVVYMNPSNANLSNIVNTSGKEFEWCSILYGSSYNETYCNSSNKYMITGVVESSLFGNVIITNE